MNSTLERPSPSDHLPTGSVGDQNDVYTTMPEFGADTDTRDPRFLQRVLDGLRANGGGTTLNLTAMPPKPAAASGGDGSGEVPQVACGVA